MSEVAHKDHDHHPDNRIFGFWIYIMSDCLIFATLFATYIVLKDSIHLGPTIKSLIELPYVLGETMLLLFSSFTYGIALLGARDNKKCLVQGMLIVTFLLGSSFLAMEMNEFVYMINHGHSWHVSAALSGFFTLVGTHGLHVLCGLIWMIVVFIQVSLHELNHNNQTKLYCLGLFWHFLDVIWICVFTIVYLMGTL